MLALAACTALGCAAAGPPAGARTATTPETLAEPASAPPASGPAPREGPRDPDDAPFLPPPQLQPRIGEHARDVDATRFAGPPERVLLTVAPSYAVFRVPFRGRASSLDPTRGVGLSAELDVRLVGVWYLRLLGTTSLHPVPERYVVRDEQRVRVANAGLLTAWHAGAGVAYAVDLDRWRPTLEAGAGVLGIAYPAPADAGQAGGACGAGGACDPGSACSPAGVCEPQPVAAVHVGGAFDLRLTQRLSLGVSLRYFNLFGVAATLPMYLTGGVRLSARW